MKPATRFKLLLVLTAPTTFVALPATAREFVQIELTGGESLSGERIHTAPDGRITIQFRGTVTRVVRSFSAREVASVRPLSPPAAMAPAEPHHSYAEMADMALFGESPESLPVLQTSPGTATS